MLVARSLLIIVLSLLIGQILLTKMDSVPTYAAAPGMNVDAGENHDTPDHQDSMSWEEEEDDESSDYFLGNQGWELKPANFFQAKRRTASRIASPPHLSIEIPPES